MQSIRCPKDYCCHRLAHIVTKIKVLSVLDTIAGVDYHTPKQKQTIDRDRRVRPPPVSFNNQMSEYCKQHSLTDHVATMRPVDDRLWHHGHHSLLWENVHNISNVT